jgi:hypothetical protein
MFASSSITAFLAAQIAVAVLLGFRVRPVLAPLGVT